MYNNKILKNKDLGKMSIQGIDEEKCILCRNCIESCGRGLFSDKEQDKIIFQDPENDCSRCGHCIARCPEDVVIYKEMGEAKSFEGIKNLEEIIPYNDMYNFLQAHRSVRQYKKDKVPNEVLRKVFDAMQCAPTARNMRSESYTILSEEDQIISLSDAIIELISETSGIRELYAERLARARKLFKSPIFFDAPHVIIISSKNDTESEANNIGIIVTYGRLAAQAIGLGTCWNGLTQFAMNMNRKLARTYGIRGKRVGVFTIGYPASTLTFYRTAPRSIRPVKGLD